MPEQKITVEEALHADTQDNAYGVFAQHSRGMLKPGFRADRVVFDRDPTFIPPTTISEVRVRMTTGGGKIAYQP